MKESKCPLCSEKIKIGGKPWKGQQVDCPACDATLEIVELNPLSLDWPYDDSGYIVPDYEEKAEYDW